MTLPFKTHFPKDIPLIGKKPTFFIERIWYSLGENNYPKEYEEMRTIYQDRFGDFNCGGYYIPKHHTIRAGNRFKEGDKLHMVINNRTKNRFQFCPVLEVKSVQDVFMSCFKSELEIDIDDRYRYYTDKEKLALNDGFKSYEEFEAYFKYIMRKERTFSGQIIHWTDLRY